jgi:hypothetical protein
MKSIITVMVRRIAVTETVEQTTVNGVTQEIAIFKFLEISAVMPVKHAMALTEAAKTIKLSTSKTMMAQLPINFVMIPAWLVRLVVNAIMRMLALILVTTVLIPARAIVGMRTATAVVAVNF